MYKISLFLLIFFSSVLSASDDLDSIYAAGDAPLSNPLVHPDWFKHSFLELDDDLEEAIEAGKYGIIVYFGQQRCAYCLKLMQVNFGMQDIVQYTREHFDVIPIDIWSVEEVTTPDGEVLTQREYAIQQDTNFTPSLVFYDKHGDIALRLRGYYPPYQFRAALKYVVEGYNTKEPFHSYLARGDSTRIFEAGELNEENFYTEPPYNLDRTQGPSTMPLAVFFEAGECHACDILHTNPLRSESVQALLNDIESVQLDINSDIPIITPNGTRTTAKAWAKQLNLFYTPAIVFFNRQGHEILRIDSVVQLYRLRGILRYIASDAFQQYPTFQTWRAQTLDASQDEQNSRK